MTFNRILALALFACLVAGCVQQARDEPIRVVQSNSSQVILRGLVDATRTDPPPAFDAVAARECARHGGVAEYVARRQRNTFGFDLTYRCVTGG